MLYHTWIKLNYNFKLKRMFTITSLISWKISKVKRKYYYRFTPSSFTFFIFFILMSVLNPIPKIHSITQFNKLISFNYIYNQIHYILYSMHLLSLVPCGESVGFIGVTLISFQPADETPLSERKISFYFHPFDCSVDISIKRRVDIFCFCVDISLLFFISPITLLRQYQRLLWFTHPLGN